MTKRAPRPAIPARVTHNGTEYATHCHGAREDGQIVVWLSPIGKRGRPLSYSYPGLLCPETFEVTYRSRTSVRI